MNAKQIACLVLLLGIVVLVQMGKSFLVKAQALDVAAAEAGKGMEGLKTQLAAEEVVFNDLQRQSDELIGFVEKWEPYFAVLDDQQAAETGISMKVREAEMLNLSQRYQQIPHKINNQSNDSLPILMRATLVFDDSHAKLLNWIGRMDKIKPTMRIGRLELAKGSRGDDLRMEVTLEVPLRYVAK